MCPRSWHSLQRLRKTQRAVRNLTNKSRTCLLTCWRCSKLHRHWGLLRLLQGLQLQGLLQAQPLGWQVWLLAWQEALRVEARLPVPPWVLQRVALLVLQQAAEPQILLRAPLRVWPQALLQALPQALPQVLPQVQPRVPSPALLQAQLRALLRELLEEPLQAQLQVLQQRGLLKLRVQRLLSWPVGLHCQRWCQSHPP